MLMNCDCAMTRMTGNLAGRVERRTLHGREYLVAPLSMIVPGVLNGSRGALFYPLDEISATADAWNGMPIVVGHPMIGGRNVSARSPDVLEQFGIGTVYNTAVNGKLTAEGWFDVERTKAIEPQILSALMRGEPIELSTGLFTDNEARPGVHNGVSYTHVARNYRPDHLAILTDQKGACPLEAGCGVLANAMGFDPDDILPNPSPYPPLPPVGRDSGDDDSMTSQGDDAMSAPVVDWEYEARLQRQQHNRNLW
jgi:hypothetical protein